MSVPLAVDTAPQSSVSRLRQRMAGADQAGIVLVVTAAIIALAAVFVRGFASLGNFSSLLRLTAALGVVAVGSAIVILAKGVDLSAAAMVAVVAQGCVVFWTERGTGEAQAILIVLALALAMGIFNGVMVAYVELPALFVTLGTSQMFLGLAKIRLLDSETYSLPNDSSIVVELGRGSVFGVPTPIVVMAVVFLTAHWFITRTSYGRMIRALGDNPSTARMTGAPVRPLIVSTFVIAAALAFIGGLLTLGRNGGYSTSYGAGNGLLFDAITVAVIGGVSLTGGRGSMFGVAVGTVLIAVIVNVMTLLDFSIVQRNLTKGLVLIAALALDAWLHPRDEETAKSDDL